MQLNYNTHKHKTKLRKLDHSITTPTPQKKISNVPTGKKKQYRVKGTPLVIGQVTVVVEAAAGGGLGVEPAGPEATAAAEE